MMNIFNQAKLSNLNAFLMKTSLLKLSFWFYNTKMDVYGILFVSFDHDDYVIYS